MFLIFPSTGGPFHFQIIQSCTVLFWFGYQLSPFNFLVYLKSCFAHASAFEDQCISLVILKQTSSIENFSSLALLFCNVISS